MLGKPAMGPLGALKKAAEAETAPKEMGSDVFSSLGMSEEELRTALTSALKSTKSVEEAVQAVIDTISGGGSEMAPTPDMESAPEDMAEGSEEPEDMKKMA